MLDYPTCLKLKEAGLNQKGGRSYYLEAGHKYGDGYSNTASELSEAEILEIGSCRFGRGSRSDTPNSSKGEIEFDAIKYPEYRSDNYWEYPMEACVKIPSLEELIEACKDRFYRLTRVSFEIWEAYGHEVLTRQEWNAEGETPEEAVANLWLALAKSN